MAKRGREFLSLAYGTRLGAIAMMTPGGLALTLTLATIFVLNLGCHSISGDLPDEKWAEGKGQWTMSKADALQPIEGLPPVPPAEPHVPEKPKPALVALLFADDSLETSEEEDEGPRPVVMQLSMDQVKSEEPGLPVSPEPAPATASFQATADVNSLTPRENLVAQAEEAAEMPAVFPPFSCSFPGDHLPREMFKVSHGPYIIEPPDILLVEAAPLSFLDGPTLMEQRISGEHLVRPDGTVGLGIYGSVRVAGLTMDEAQTAIQDHLKKALKIKINPKVNVDVFAYNSKAYYIISDNAGYGQPVVRLPFTGNETVLDAIGQIGGLPAAASKKKIWIARPGPDHHIQTLPVDWKGITQDGRVATNYQLFPGDRIYIQSDRLMALDGLVSKIVAPIERVLGVTFLGAQTIFRLQNMGRGAGGVASGGI
jgi:polysaccharide export outer membrane protein